MIESIKKKIMTIFPEKEKPDSTIQTTKEQKIKPESTLIGFVREKSLKISVSTQDGDLTSFEIPDRTKKLEEVKKHILSKLGLPTSGRYDFVRLSDQTKMRDDQDFSSFDSQETIIIVVQESSEEATMESCFMNDDMLHEEIQGQIEIYFSLANKLVRYEISKSEVENLAQISRVLFADYNGHFEFFHFGVEFPVSKSLNTWISKSKRLPPLVCLGPSEISDDYKNYVAEVSSLWDEPFSSEPIPFVIDTQIKKEKNCTRLVKNIREAVGKFEARTPVKFVELEDEALTKYYFAWIHIYLSDTNEIDSGVGRSVGPSPIRLKSYTPTNFIMHELMHVLGFVHEQQRPDRDLFVDINNKFLENTDHSKYKTFYPIGTYDAKSIMHYHFIENELQPKPDGLLTTQEKEILENPKFPTDFSEGDIDAIEFVYGCKLTCTFEKTVREYTSQPYYECITCWGENSRAGCCASCRRFCHKEHEVIYHPPGDEQFFCDCGVNKHELACTKASTGNIPCLQPMFTYLDCPTEDPICFPCATKLNCEARELKEDLIKGICACKNQCCNTRTKSLLNI